MFGRKSVAVTEISKMVFCEASVVRTEKLSKQDHANLKRGRVEHERFSRDIAGVGVFRWVLIGLLLVVALWQLGLFSLP